MGAEYRPSDEQIERMVDDHDYPTQFEWGVLLHALEDNFQRRHILNLRAMMEWLRRHRQSDVDE